MKKLTKEDKNKLKILASLEDNRRKFLNIEIKRSYNKGKWDLRNGDIVGSTEFSNVSKEDILREISDEMENLEYD